MMADSSNPAPFGGDLSQDKGKGKAVQEDVSMGEDTEISSDESGPEDVVCLRRLSFNKHSLPFAPRGLTLTCLLAC